MDMVFGFADRVIVMDRGAIIASGAPAEIRANPDVQKAYLGYYEEPADETKVLSR